MTLLSSVGAVEETPVDRYLADQANLTAVERFSQRHEAEVGHRQARYYRDLIPMARPEPGQQYAFEVDLDACTGCKACVSACHSLNGLDEDESWRSVTLLRGGTADSPFQQSVTSACHHCVDPACMGGCPVDAYEKDPETGIVVHLDDQCIGCGYCTLTCPYEVPLLSAARGIVRKCDMCQGRLAAGEAPACVQACPNGAIAITVIESSAALVVAARPGAVLVPGQPPSSITQPTTVYRTARPAVLDAAMAVRPPATPAHAHPPLAVMLVLTQLSVGAFVVDLLLRALSSRDGPGGLRTLDALVAVGAGGLALGASVLHLGRPRYFYRAVIGLRHSWLSREVLAFGTFMPLAGLYALVVGAGWPVASPAAANALGLLVAGTGVAGVACSVQLYAVTRRRAWRARRVGPAFAATSAICGLAAVFWASVLSALFERGAASALAGSGTPMLVGLAAVTAGKLAAELTAVRRTTPAPKPGDGDRARVTTLLRGPLRRTFAARMACGVAGGVALPLVVAALGPAGQATWAGAGLATAVLVTVTAGELLERSLFFTTAGPPR